MKNIKTCKEKHSIQVVAFVIEFEEELNIDSINNISSLHEEENNIKKFFSRKENQIGVTIQIDETGKQITSNSVQGILFVSNDSSWTLQVRKDAMIVTCKEYTRWKEVWEKISDFFSLCFPYISVRFRGVTLEYINEYYIGRRDSAWQEELFNKESKYLTKSIFEKRNTSWHLHQGFFSSYEEKIKGEVLTNLNVDFRIEKDNDDLLIMRTQHKNAFEKNIFATDISSYLKDIFDYLHDLNKNILKELLSEGIISKINLEGDKSE